ncbi:MAG: RNA methyltransferase [Lentimicrobiaceae bacterium]|jgi:TrmH family RNA methyltransferase|nr:RNA methyltransferase [Lentimicrobiaceae bacterium]
MPTKKQLQQIRSLQTLKFRKEHGLFIVEGTKMVTELLLSNIKIVQLLVSNEWLSKNVDFDFFGNTFENIDNKQMNQISSLQTPPGILVVAKIPQYHIVASDSENELVLMLDGINDPGNLGTIIRTAEWFGIRKIVCSTDCADFWNPKVVQATMGSAFRMQLETQDLESFLNQTTENVPIYGALLEGKNVFKTTFKQTNGILIIGSESHGIRDYLKPFINKALYIVSHSDSKAESLNAAIATAIILAELRKTTLG